jgi:D-tyrosyl-tRNA(Tyr) deacylase
MRIVIQRVTYGEVIAGEKRVGNAGPGLAVFLGVAREDTEANADYLIEKIKHLRIFEDEYGKMNRSLLDVGGELLVVSEFTLYGDCSKGTRPSFSHAAPPAEAKELYHYFVGELRNAGLRVSTGVFQARMKVTLQNDGPVTLIMDK